MITKCLSGDILEEMTILKGFLVHKRIQGATLVLDGTTNKITMATSLLYPKHP